MNSRTLPLLTQALVVSFSLLLASCSGDEQKARSFNRPALPFAVAAVEDTEYQFTLTVIGSAEADEAVDITPAVAETIEKIYFREGEEVKEGEILVSMSQAAEIAQREQARIHLANERRELARLKGLRESRSVSQTDYDRQETNTKLAELQLDEVETRIADRTIRAPFDGVVGLRELSPGAFVTPGQRITTLDKINPIKVDFRIPSVFVGKLAVGARIEAKPAGSDAGFDGTVVAVSSRITAESRTFEAVADLPNPEGKLHPGMLMRVTLFGRKIPALKVPEPAILQIGTRHYVFRVTAENTVSQTLVELVGREPGWVYITNGLGAGDQVVAEGTHRLRDGQPIAMKQEARAPETDKAQLQPATSGS